MRRFQLDPTVRRRMVLIFEALTLGMEVPDPWHRGLMIAMDVDGHIRNTDPDIRSEDDFLGGSLPASLVRLAALQLTVEQEDTIKRAVAAKEVTG